MLKAILPENSKPNLQYFHRQRWKNLYSHYKEARILRRRP
jgi:hypothetical protein